MNTNKPTIFLCHAHIDKPFVHRLAADLMRYGVEIWLDEFEIKVGDSLIQKIREGIDRMDYLAVILSPESVASEWVRHEVDVAMNQEIEGRQVKVLPILYRACELPGFLKGKLYADFSSEMKYENSLDSVLARLNIARSIRQRTVPTISQDAAKTLLASGITDWRFHDILLDETRLQILSESEIILNEQEVKLVTQSIERLLAKYEWDITVFYDKHDTGDDVIDATYDVIKRVNRIIRWAARNGAAKEIAQMKQKRLKEYPNITDSYGFNPADDIFGTEG